MKKTIRISGGVSGVIATGPYQNLRPEFRWEEIIEDCQMSDSEIKQRIQTLYNANFEKLKNAEQIAIVERIQRERKDLRILKSPKTNKMLPSVTSIINYDVDFFVSQEDLRQYASQGSIIDARVRHFIRIGKWEDAEKLQETWVDRQIIARGELGLEINVGCFPGFLEKYPIKEMKEGKRFFNDEYEYCGEPDIHGIPDFAEEIPTIFDVKRTWNESYRIKFGMQLAAYCKHFGVKQGIIIPLNDKTVQGFSKPVVYDAEALDGYFELFMKKYKEFRKRYGF